MPRGYGFGRGRYGRCVGTGQVIPVRDAGDAIYVGPCRCGTGPRAFYRTGEGRLVHTREVVDVAGTPYADSGPMEALREENRALSERIRKLEERLGDK